MRRFILMLTLAVCHYGMSAGQDTLHLELKEAIRLGCENSVDALVARNHYISAYWDYRTYRTEFLPEVVLSGTTPNYSKSYNLRQNDDGSYTYVPNNYMRLDGGLSISQNIPWTGGSITVKSSAERLRQYGERNSKSYKAVPGIITLEQPLFGFNRIKWLKRTGPLKFREARQKLISNREQVALNVVGYYFELLVAQVNLDIARQNYESDKRLYIIEEGRRKLGQVSDLHLMQMKNRLLSSEASLASVRISMASRMFDLRSYLGLGKDVVIKPMFPNFVTDEIPLLDYDKVLNKARENNAFSQEVQRRTIEASREVSQAKANRWNIQMFASFGVSSQDDTFHDAISNMNWRGDQSVNIGVRVPILDWGKGKGKVRVAEANREAALVRIDKDIMDFDQNIFLLVQYFNNQPRQLQLAREMDEIAQARYNTTVEIFVKGRVQILDLNDSQTARDSARRGYIQQMGQLWNYYYQIRLRTLYDFVLDRPIEAEYPA